MSSIALLHLALIPGVGPSVVEKLVRVGGKGFIDALYDLKAGDLIARFSMSHAQAARITSGLADGKLLDEELKRIDTYAIGWTTLFDSDYPTLLKEIYLPPIVLYFLGKNPSSYKKTVAFVGARKADAYAERVARMLVSGVSEHGWCIVSGGARGADSYAHKAALESKAGTIAVLGSGLLKPYPPEHKELFKTIVKNEGTLLSSFPLTADPHPGHFPARNRIIAGLSKACIVLQACEKSGALITASYALQEGRDVGAVPGLIDNPLSDGCHKLLSEGAYSIASAKDLLNVLGEKAQIANETIKPDTIAHRIVAACRTPLSFDELLQVTGLSSSALHGELFSLQVEGKLKQNFMGLWASAICG